MPVIGLISNPLSRLNRANMAEVEDAVDGGGDVVHHRLTTGGGPEVLDQDVGAADQSRIGAS